jgi:hypothetical protein
MIWTLIPVSLIYGLVAALAFRRFSDEPAIRRTINRMMAHVMEFRLFLDSPRLVLRAQRDLFRENLRLLRLIAWPSLVLAAIFIVIFPQLDAMYGHSPLTAGEPSVVTLYRAGAGAPPALEAPPGIRIESPGVRSLRDGQVSWRVRPLGRASGQLRIRDGAREITKPIVAGGGLIDGMKVPFSQPAIEIRYPRRSILGLNWMVWFFLITSLAAVGYKPVRNMHKGYEP